MRRLGFVIAAIALLAGGAFWWAAREPEPVPIGTPASVEPHFEPVAVQRGDGQGLALSGVVTDPSGAPVPEARVRLAATAQQSFLDVHCGFCGRKLTQCRSPEAGRIFAALLDGHRGEARAALETTTDATGRFRFEHLEGVSFTVWADAAGLGTGVKDRAAPGDPVSLVLPRPRTLSGRVVDEAGQPVRARVRVTSERLATQRELSTGDDGTFSFGGLGEGPFAASVEAPGMVPLLAAALDANAGPVTLTLVRGRALDVRVVSEGAPVDAEVVLEGDHLLRTVHARDGLAHLEGLARGELSIVARHGSLASAPQILALRGLQTSITLELRSAGSLLITVVDEEGQPVPTPTVTLRTPERRMLSKRLLQTGEQGRLGPIAAGDYLVEVSAPGHRDLEQPVQVPRGERSLELMLQAAAVISGKVVDEYGRPAPDVAVLVMPGGDVPHTDAEGRFTVTLESPGLYSLHAHHSDWGGGSLKVTAPATDVVLQLDPGAGVEVLVTQGGRPVEGASVVLENQKGNFQSDRASGADGLVLMRGLPPDTYRVFAARPDSLPSAPQPVTVEDGALKRVTAELQPGGVIEGEVVDTAGAPVPDVTVALRRSPRTTTDGAGHFELKPIAETGPQTLQILSRRHRARGPVVASAGGPPVRVVVEAMPVVRGRVVSGGKPVTSFEINAETFTSSDGRFEVAAQGRAGDAVQLAIDAPGYESQVFEREASREDLGDFELKPLAALEGFVRDAAGEPVAEAVVTCDPCAKSTATDSQGHFSIGKPQLQREFSVTARRGKRSATQKVEATVAGPITLTLGAGVKVQGRAYLLDGQPAAGIEVTGFCSDTSDSVRAVTDAAGAFSIDVVPGVWNFALRTRYSRVADPPSQIIDVQSGEVSLVLGPAPELATLAVHVTPTRNFALWLVRGDPPALGNPPLELLHASWAQLLFQPAGERVVFGGLSPGRYTVIWAPFHGSIEGGPRRITVDVPASGEVVMPP